MFEFLHISVTDIIDILLVAAIIFYLFKLLKNTSAMSIFLGILSIYVVWIIVTALNMELTSSLLGQVLGVGVIALIIIFQPELRRFLFHVGSDYVAGNKGRKFIDRILHRKSSVEVSSGMLEELTAACRKMSETKTGALIVIRHGDSLAEIIETGDTINANINRRLIENLFFKNSPLHDGAVVMNENRIIAARCTLPLTGRQDLPPSYGMRHRAAIGISEQSDASVIVVSEETGNISYVRDGAIRTISSITELRLAIDESFKK